MAKTSTYSSYHVRRAHHSGSWYSDDESTLNQKLSNFLEDAAKNWSQPKQSSLSSLCGIICPHAGYSFSGPTAAYSYQALRQELLSQLHSPQKICHILVLHPSHHVYLDGCAVSGATYLETPLGNLTVDQTLRQEILSLKTDCGNGFSVMEQNVDEAEHSGEMQYPYLYKVLQEFHKIDIPVLPIMCGNLSTAKETAYGKVLAPIVERDDVFCVISTDFCHWGRRFSYQPQPSSSNKGVEIYQHIQNLDQEGMNIISMQEPGAFADYLQATRNTICGRHAVQVWLNAIKYNADSGKKTVEIDFIKYAQSSKVTFVRESSVSYASATARSTKILFEK